MALVDIPRLGLVELSRLEKGLRYFKEGRVCSLRFEEGHFEALVKGDNDLYHVSMDFKGLIPQLYCTCKDYHVRGKICKHLIAAWFEYRRLVALTTLTMHVTVR